MKKILFIVALTLAFVSCSDKVYKEINTDPTKGPEMNPSLQLTYSALQLYGDMNYVDVHRLYTYAFTQQLMGCWNTTNYGGQHRMDDQEMARPWNNLYTAAFRNLTDGIENSKNDSSQVNVNAALRIMRVYVGSLMTDYYGDVPYSEAGLAYITGNSQPKYDKQDELYNAFFAELKASVKAFDVQKEPITSDPIFNGDIESWKKFANSLRLRYAMRLSDVAPAVAQKEFTEALQEDGYMKSSSDDAYVKHMNISYSFGQEAYKDFRGNALSKYFFGNDPSNNPTYICQTLWEQLYNNKDPRTNRLCRFYIDDFQSISTGEGRVDVTDAIMAQQASNPNTVYLIAPGEFSWDNWPSYNEVRGSALAKQLAEIKKAHPDYNPEKNTRWLMPKLAQNFLRSDNPGILMTYAEVCFLRAEAAVLWSTGDDKDDLYKKGIRAAMDLYSDYYGCAAITAEEFNAYIEQPAIALTAGKEKEQINTQAWILHFHNPAECWANTRRADFPALTPPKPDGKNPLIDGKDIPVRLCYPLKEETYSKDAYQEAIGRVAGKYDWHARLWWDVK